MGSNIGKIFMHGRSQAVRLPKEFRLPGTEVRIVKDGNRLILEPVEFDAAAWLMSLQANADPDFMKDGREQPPMPDDDIDLDR